MNDKFKKLIFINRWLVGILIICFFLTVGYAFYFQIKPQVDARAYDVIAQNIANGAGFRENLEVPLKNDSAILRVGPVYEYFLAGIYKIFGHHYEAVWIIQALLRVFTVWFLYLSVLLIFKNRENKKQLGLWSAAIIAFYPDLIEISAMLMTETLYLFFVVLLLYAFLKYLDQLNWRWFIFLSLISGLAVLARPPILFILPIILFCLFKQKKWKEMLVYFFILIAIFIPWTVRNYQAYGFITPFGVAGSANFWIGNHIGANGEQETNAEIDEFIRSHNLKELNNKSISEFKNFVFNHPVDFAKLSLSRINKYFSVLRPMGFWFYSSGWQQILFVLSSAVFSLAVFILSLAGIIQTLKNKDQTLYYPLAFTVFTPLILFITVVETRYRFQIYPFLAIFTAYFISHFKSDKKIWLKTLVLSSAIILSNGLLDGLVNIEHFKSKIASCL